MKYQFIEEYKQEFPIVAMCGVLARLGKRFLCLAYPSCLPTIASKMLSELRKSGRCLRRIKGDMVPHVSNRDLHDEGITCSRKRVERRDARGGAVSQPATASGENDKKRRNASGDSEHVKSRFSSGRAEQEMGDGHYIYTNNAGMVVCSSYFGFLLPNGGRRVDVKQLR